MKKTILVLSSLIYVNCSSAPSPIAEDELVCRRACERAAGIVDCVGNLDDLQCRDRIVFQCRTACARAQVPASPVGSACVDGVECGDRPGAACLALWPDGYCTEFSCAPETCPAGSACVFALWAHGVGYQPQCLRTCEEDLGCRADYYCADVGQPVRVCLPGRAE